MEDLRIRPMDETDVAVAERISDDAFFALDTATRSPSGPEPRRRSPQHRATWEARTRSFLDSDPGGSWVAERDGEVIGLATSFRREAVWCLATFAVRPGLQGAGVGVRLLQAALSYGDHLPRGMLAASVDPRALRRYHLAGFTLHPQLTLRGTVDRSGLPAVSGVRDGRPEDLEWMDALDRLRRGGPHGPDHHGLMAAARVVVTTDRTGYAYTDGRALAVLAAADDGAAQRLLCECLASADGPYEVQHVTSANYWAVRTAMAARMDMTADGYLGLRGMTPPAPYIHHGSLL